MDEKRCSCECHEVGCEETRYYFKAAEEAWEVIRKFERQFLATTSAVRGVERSLDRRPAFGRRINKT